MATEVSDLFKANVMSFIREYAEEIASSKVQVAMNVKKLSKLNLLSTNTTNVNKNTWIELKSTFGIESSDFIKLNVIPLMPPLLCHENSKFLNRLNSNISPILGFNITAGDDGKFFSLELHSVVQYKGEYYDFTRDFFDESSKYFIPITNYNKSNSTPREIFKTMTFLGFPDGYIYNKKNYTCGKYKYTCPNNQAFNSLKHRCRLLMMAMTS